MKVLLVSLFPEDRVKRGKRRSRACAGVILEDVREKVVVPNHGLSVVKCEPRGAPFIGPSQVPMNLDMQIVAVLPAWEEV